MKLQNSTDFPDHFLRRMIAWCRKESGLPARKIEHAIFRNTSAAFSGWASYGLWIRVSIGPDSAYPVEAFTRHGTVHPAHADRIEGLVSTTAHELQHLAQYTRGRHRFTRRNMEPECIRAETRALAAFREQRDALLAAWYAPPAAKAKQQRTISIVDKRASKAAADLARWQKKLKLAQTKIRKYRQRVRYYERKAATRSPARED